MRRKILTSVLISIILVLASDFSQAQDPGEPDTVWISRVPMSHTWDPFHNGGRPFGFTVKCSVFTDEYLAGINIPISFYHSENRDILVDSIHWSDWVLDVSGGVLSIVIQNDSIAETPCSTKLFRVGAVWFSDSLPPGTGVLFTVYFNGDYNLVPDWDTSKSIVLDSMTTRHPYPLEETHLELMTTMAKTFTPVFHYGVIGDTVIITGKAYKNDGITPDAGATVYCRGKDITTSYFPGRVFQDIIDSSGNFRFAVGKGGCWCVFMDTTGGLDSTTNSFCFSNLITDVTGLEFKGKTGVEEIEDENKVIPEEFSLLQNYPNPFNPKTKICYTLPIDCKVRLSIYNILGQRIRVLVDEHQKAGYRSVFWDGKDEKGGETGSGVYFYRIQADKFTQTKKMLFLR